MTIRLIYTRIHLEIPESDTLGLELVVNFYIFDNILGYTLA